MEKVEICPCCGAKVVTYKYRFNERLASCLLSLNHYNGKSISEMGLTNPQYASFHKLKYFGLACKIGNSEKYSITEYGSNVLAGKEKLPEYVLIRKGEIVEVSPKRIWIWDATPEVDRREYYAEQVKEGLQN